MKIGLLLICTGKYDVFLPKLFDSIKKYFFVDESVNIFLFTDSQYWLDYKEKNYNAFYQKHETFPASTLKRYEIFSSRETILKEMDYLFYCDVDMLFVDHVTKEILGDRVAVIHPGFLGGVGTPERRRESLAFISENEKNIYFAGGFNGGTSEEFLKMCKILSTNINIDLKNGIIAIWHDESHMNRYFLDNSPTKILSPSYCYPESWNLPFKKILLALDKDHKEIRG